MPVVRWRTQLARRTTILHRKREPFRRCSSISGHADRSHSARHGVCARKARVFRHLPRESQRSGACARATRMLAALLEVRARTSHHGLAPKMRCLPPVQYLSDAPGPAAASATRRSRAASLRGLSPPETQPTQCGSCVGHAKAGCLLEVTARMLQQCLTPKGKGLPPVQCPFGSCRQTTTRAARRARMASLRVLPPPERQPEQWPLHPCHANAGSAMEVTARTSHHGLARKQRGLSPVQHSSKSRKHVAAGRHGARARQARVLCHFPRHSQRSCARASVTHKPAA